MKTKLIRKVRSLSVTGPWLCVTGASCLLLVSGVTAHASVAYGTINNFDTVNDTGQECHGFEIELEDIESHDVTYCYSYNHYGTPSIQEDTSSNPGHTNVIVRYAALWTNGAWSAYTAIPAGPIAPTQGHQFTNPSTNFGGEHFGVGYRRQPARINYNWLVDNGAGVLVRGPAVLVSTPVFTYIPPANGLPGRVAAEIEPAPEPPVREFGSPSWVKAIVTTSHTNREIRLRNLVSPDPDYPDEEDWRNGEPDEVETEWELLQVEFGSGNNDELVGAEDELAEGDEIITRRYEFYAYVGPLDAETGEALADKVGPDGIHGVDDGVHDYSTTVIVGEYLGAQMSAFDHELAIGLIDHVADGEINMLYPTRSVVVAGIPFIATMTGTLPGGMSFNTETGELSGTPTTSGIFTFRVRASAADHPDIEKAYTFAIPAAGENLPPHSTVDTVSEPLDSGDTTGTGLYTNGVNAMVTAEPAEGFKFSHWTDNGKAVSTDVTLQFEVVANRSLVANFIPLPPRLALTRKSAGRLQLSWPTNDADFGLQTSSPIGSGDWTTPTNATRVVGTNNEMEITPGGSSALFRLMKP